MILLPRRCLLALAAVVDVAVHARPTPVAAKALAARLNLPPRHLESLLQALVRAGILKGVRGPRGGYELARERRRITAAEIVQAVATDVATDTGGTAGCRLIADILAPLIENAGRGFLLELDAVTIDDICRRGVAESPAETPAPTTDFTI